MAKDKQLLERVAEIYSWLDSQIEEHDELTEECKGCGACCDFESFDHHLFVTSPALVYLAAKVGDENIKPMTNGRCPYQTNNKCTVYENRFAGCRIFHCRGDKDFQSELSESALKRLKLICAEFQISYRYSNLAEGLNGFVDG